MCNTISCIGTTSNGKTINVHNIPNDEKICVRFTNGVEAVYTMEIFWLLITDYSVDMIASNETGEVYFY